MSVPLWLAALIVWIIQVGFVGQSTPSLHWATLAISLLYAFEQIWMWRRSLREAIQSPASAFHLFVALISAVAMVVISLMEAITGQETKVTLLAHVLVQMMIIGDLSLRGLRHQAKITAVTLRPGWLLMGSFSTIIVIGAALLKLPRAVVEGQHLTWLDAFFTSTSAVCVTGLTIHNTAEFFTPTGQLILLTLFQTGGLGIMTLTFFMAALLFQGMSLHDRFLLGEMIAEKRLAHVGETLRFVVRFTFVTEAIGAVALYFCFPFEGSPGERAYQAVFHSVSAFCNAGFSTLPQGLADPWVQDAVGVQLIIALVAVAGAVGSLPAYDTLSFLRQKFKKWRHPDTPRPRLRVHTRLVLVMTVGVLFCGSLAIYLSEYVLHHGQSNGGAAVTSLFQAMCARTAGFNTVAMEGLGPLTIHIMVFLMLIGGSPGGTAGGLRTTVFSTAVMHLWHQLRGAGDLVIFRRRLPSDIGPRALGIIVMAIGWLFVNFAILRQLQPGASDTRLVFELISAFSTAGLSLDLTSQLTPGAKLLIIGNMFIGRVGLVTTLLTIMPLRSKPRHSHPQEDILLF